MIPQKFLMMKCIRILFILHVVGILFFAYKLYNIYTAEPRSPLVTSRAAVSWNKASNNSKSNMPVGFNHNFDERNNVVADNVADNEEGTLSEYDNEENEYQETTPQNKDDLDYQDEIDDENQEETKDVDEYDDEYDDETERSKNDRPGNSAANVKNGSPDLIFKGQQGQPVPVPAAALKNSHWTLTNAGKYSKSLYTSPQNERPTQRLPQAIVIGSPNSGIRPLLDFLEIHPQLVPVKKEVPFFDEQNRLQLFSNWFLSQMPLSYSDQITVGRTHFAHWNRKAVCELYQRKQSMRVIIVLRDPVSRILSQATAKNLGTKGTIVVAQHGATLKINNDTEALDWGRYVEYVKMWTQCFPKFQIHVVEWSDIMQRPAETVHKIEGFLGVSYRANEDNYERDENRRAYCIRPFHVKGRVCLSEKKGRSPTLTPQEEALIYRFYSKHNEELFKLLGHRFEWGPAGGYSRS